MLKRDLVRHAALLSGGILLAFTGCQQTGTTDGAGAGTGTEFNDGSAGSSPEGETVMQAVYFDYDKSELREDARTTLQSNRSEIDANPGWTTIVIEGHCDERGTEEYNLALGERRANSVLNYLVDLGVPAARFRTVSFGEARPAVDGHDESAWRYNRRSEFKAIR